MNTQMFLESEEKKEHFYNMMLTRVMTINDLIKETGFSKSKVKFMLYDLINRGNIESSKHMNLISMRYVLYFRSTTKPFVRKTISEVKKEKKSNFIGGNEFFNPFVKAPTFEATNVRKYSMDKPAAKYVAPKRKTVVSIVSSFEACI